MLRRGSDGERPSDKTKVHADSRGTSPQVDDPYLTVCVDLEPDDDVQPVHDDELLFSEDASVESAVSGIRRPGERATEDVSLGSDGMQSRVVHVVKDNGGVRELIREGDVLLGKYRVEHVVIRNLVVNATVTHIDLRRRARLTLLSADGRGSAAAQAQFGRATKALIQMKSEFVCHILDAGVLGSNCRFRITELTGDTDLAEYLSERGPLPITEAIDFAIQVAEALAEAHAFGICHGGLTPENVRIATGVDGSPVVKLLGLGVMAHWAIGGAIDAVRTLDHAGSPLIDPIRYLSPEQIRHPDQVDARTDLWSLGALLHEMLAGTPAFLADTPTATLAMVAADAPAALSSICSDIPRQLESAVLRCLDKDRQARFPGVAEFARALQPHASADGQAIVERIGRVVARGNARTRGTHHSAQRTRSHSLGRAWFAATMLGVALLAGTTGAIVAARWLPPAKAVAAPAAQTHRGCDRR